MSSYPNNVIPINRKSAGASVGGNKVGGQFAATVHPVSPVELGGGFEASTPIPPTLLMAHFQDPGLVNALGIPALRGHGSEDSGYYREEFASLLPHVDREEARRLYDEVGQALSEGGAATPLLVEAAALNTRQHPGGQLADGYVPPTSTIQERGTRRRPVVTGSKHQNTFRDVAAISKDIRADLKAATAANYLPQGLSYSVKSARFSQGQAVDIVVQGLPDADRYDPVETDFNGKPVQRPESIELLRRLELVAGAYNRSDEDNYSSDYYATVYIESDFDRFHRERESQERRARTAKA